MVEISTHLRDIVSLQECFNDSGHVNEGQSLVRVA